VAILKEADASMTVADICRKHCISDATYYNWKSKFEGMEASDLNRMKELARENDAMRSLIEKML
jgi:putative transposase